MMTTKAASPCPPAASLADYLLGTLDDLNFESIDSHVSACEQCRSSIAAMPDSDDSLDDCLKQLGDSFNSTADEEPRSVNAYDLIGRLGRGGMGEVHRARHRFLGHEAAVKLLTQSGPARSRFLQEMRVARAVQHPNVVRIEDAGETPDGRLYLAMELLEGENLAELVRRKGPLPASEACEIVRQLAEGLSAAHAIGVVHRDVKPANAMLCHSGVVKLLDLGLCRRFDGVDVVTGEAMTQEGQLLGTPDFMAPEQARDPRRVDARGDIYALGCTLYFLLAGRKPFEGENYATLQAKLIAHAAEECPPVERIRGELPRGLPELVRRWMAKSPADRPESAAAAAAELAAFTVDADLRTVTLPGETTPIASPKDPTIVRRSHRWLRWLRLSAAVVATAALVWRAGSHWMEQQRPNNPNQGSTDVAKRRETIDAFLKASPISNGLRTAMQEAVAARPERASWTGEFESTAFAIAVQAKPSGGVVGLAEAPLRSIASAKAARELMLAAAAREEFGKKNNLTDADILRSALEATGWEFAGSVVQIQRQDQITDQGAIAWITAPKLNIAAMMTKPTHLAAIRKAYAAAGVERINADSAARKWAEALRTADHLAACGASTLDSELAACGALLELTRDQEAVARLDATMPRLSGTSNAKLYDMLGNHAWTACERQRGRNEAIVATAEKLAREAWKAALTIEQGKPAP